MSGAVRILAAPGLVKLRSASELVGRRDEFGALDGELSRATAEEFRLVLLLGEAGVARAASGASCWHARGDGLGRQGVPAASAAFGLWTEALDPFLQSLPASEVIELCDGPRDRGVRRWRLRAAWPAVAPPALGRR